ncbi:MAG: hypothetical protein K2N51_12935 [Lachnospiraceae bacterium]|nr:hypothetical protein [Lachnospiraceae bacterium]
MVKGLESRSAKMPMLEIIITIGIFAVASVFILELFLSANTLQNRAKDQSKAVVLAETIAETVKSCKVFEEAADGLGLEKTVARITQQKNGSYEISKIDEPEDMKDGIAVYTGHFDENWKAVKEEDTYSVIVIPYEEQVQGSVMANYEVYIYRLKGYVSVMGEKDSEELYHMSFSHLQDTKPE